MIFNCECYGFERAFFTLRRFFLSFAYSFYGNVDSVDYDDRNNYDDNYDDAADDGRYKKLEALKDYLKSLIEIIKNQ